MKEMMLLKLKQVNSKRFFISLIITLIIQSPFSMAFFSPSLIELLRITIPEIIKTTIIILSTFFITKISFLKSKKLKKKRIIMIIALISVLLFLSLLFYNYQKYSNIEMLENHVEEMVNNGNFHNFKYSHYISLENISNIDFKKYQIFYIHTNFIKLKGSEPFLENKYMINNPKKFQQILNDKVNKNKILFYCSGDTSALLAYISNSFGYDAYWTKVINMNNPDRFDLDILKELSSNDKINIKSYEKKTKNKTTYIDVECALSRRDSLNKLFREVNYYCLYDKRFSSSEPIYKIKNLKEVILNSDIICSSKLNCLVSQAILKYYNLTNKINTIYNISDNKLIE